jgi:very-short-patch-repair endonuclease
VVGTKMRVDFLNISKKIAIEVNGDQHSQIHWFHGHEPANYQAQLIRDVKKERWCEKNGYKFVEIYARDMPLTEKFFLDKYEIQL